MTLQEWIEANKRLCTEATAGPWSVYHRGCDKVVTVAVCIGDAPDGRRPCVVDWPGFDSSGLPSRQNVANAEFMAASRISLPQALRIIEELTMMPEKKLTYVDRWRFNENKLVAEQILNKPPEGATNP